MMTRSLRMRFWVEAALAVASVALLLLTVISHDWIEAVTGLDPDQHSGALEWLIVGATVAAALTFMQLARVEWRRAAGNPGPA
jgi:hypothetical protein